MNFLIDAQLPHRLVHLFQTAGHEAIHVSTFAAGNRTRDSFINQYSFDHECVVVTKDSDFVNSFLISQRPYKLLLITTGNITNEQLASILMRSMSEITANFSTFSFIEINREAFIVHV